MRHEGQILVDGAMSMEIPAGLARELGATHVISVYLPAPEQIAEPGNVFQVDWRTESDLVITPDVGGVEWDGFGHGEQLIEAGEAAAVAALGKVRQWFGRGEGARTA